MMPALFDWDCSLYMNHSKRWKYGKMYLYEDCIKYIEGDTNKPMDNRFKLLVKFTSIHSMTRAKSTLIFNCIVITVRGSSLWFASFRNCEQTLSFIEHFWRGWLLGDTPRAFKHTDGLMRLVCDTQDTLMNAASTLHKQGDQLNRASQTMNSLVDNIKVAERITEDINSWFGAWRVKAPFRKSSNKNATRSKQPVDTGRIEYPVLYARHQQESHYDGFMVIIESGVQIYNGKSEVQHSLMKGDNVKIDVHSPFDITLTKRHIGKSDWKLHVVSNEMPFLMNTLKEVCGFGYELEQVPDTDPVVDGLNEEIGFDLQPVETTQGDGVVHDKSSSQLQHQRLSDNDANQISSVLQNIKNLAVDISSEQDAQIQQIDEINRTIDRAETRLSSTNYKINKML